MDIQEIKSANERLRAHLLSMVNPETWTRTLAMSDESIASFADTPWLRDIDTVYLVGHGTSFATSMNAESAISHIARVHAQAVSAYTFATYAGDYIMNPGKTLVVAISCSGDGASVVGALKAARSAGAHTMVISGEGDILAAPHAELRILTDARVESRANVQAYSISHLFILLAAHRFALLLGQKNGHVDQAQAERWDEQLNKTIETMTCLPKLFDQMHEIYRDLETYGAKNFAVLGTGPNRGTAQEGALKISEYCWRFGAAEELEDFAHGRFREVGSEEPLFIISPTEKTYAKTMDLLTGCYISKTPAVVFTAQSTPAMEKLATHVVTLPSIDDEYMTPFLYIFPMWFYGFHVRNEENGLVGEKRHGLYAVDINFSARFTEDGTLKG